MLGSPGSIPGSGREMSESERVLLSSLTGMMSTFSTLWVNSADDKLMIFFLSFFSVKTGLTFHANFA